MGCKARAGCHSDQEDVKWRQKLEESQSIAPRPRKTTCRTLKLPWDEILEDEGKA